MDFLIFAITFAVFLLSLVFYLYHGSNRATTIPGADPSDPKDGNWADIKAAGSIHEFLVDLHNKHGDIVSFWMGQQMAVSIASPALFREHSKVFDRPVELFSALELLFTKYSIQTANGAEGQKRRRMYDVVYSHDMMRNYFEIFIDNSSDILKKLGSTCEEEHIPLMEQMFDIAIKGITRATLGAAVSNETILKLRHSNDNCWTEVEAHMAGDISDPDSDRMKLFYKEREAMMKIISDAIERRRANPPKSGEELLVDVLLDRDVPEHVALADALLFFVAGNHTVAELLLWAFYYLTINPDVEMKVLDEIASVLKDGEISPANIADLKYLRQVLDEVLRISVVATMAARYQDVDVKLAGHTIPANTPVIHALGVVLLDPKIWPEPHRFDPERFSPKNVRARKNYSFEPFGFGKRKCPGFRLAIVEALIVIALVLPKYRFKLVEGQVVVPKFGFVTQPADEIWVTVEKRK